MFMRELGRMAGVLIGLLLAALPVAGQPTAADPAQLAGQGENLFRQKCAVCHSLGGGDRVTGPDLAGVTERRERQWLIDFIEDPAKMFDAGDASAVALREKFNNLPMPALQLDSGEVEALLAYLSLPAEAAAPPRVEQASAAPQTAGDAARGAKLFSGEIPLANGGAPCLGCHGIAGVGLAGGANYGPDLTMMAENYGEEGVASVLESLPFPSMEPIYASRPLTEAEQADLGAYFAQVDDKPMVNDRLLLGEVSSGVLALLIVMLLLGWGRLHGVRRSLVNRTSNQKGGKR